jgi:acetyl-CoA acetyltransferase
MRSDIRNKAAIVGIGQTEYSKQSGRSELSLACEAIKNAMDDAGIEVAEIDGLVRYDMDSVDEVALTSHLGLKNLSWMSHTGYGGTGGNAVIVHAAAAIAAGVANTVVCYRALNERSGKRYGRGETWMQDGARGHLAFQMPWGMLTPVHQFGQFARRHMVQYGTTSRQFGAVAVAMRRHATMNPHAMMRTPISIEDHQGSRMIADPLRLYDCCIESDGACAVIVTAADRARRARHAPAWIRGAAQGSGTRAAGIVFRDDLANAESVNTAKDVYNSAGLGPQDVDVLMVYDHFTPFVIFSLEAYGFCKPGEGGPFVEGGRIEYDGQLPVNTHGGNLSEAYIHGLPHIIEGVRQLRGTSTAQVARADVVLSCSSVAQLSAAVILCKEQ